MSDESSNAQTQPATGILRDYLREAELAQEIHRATKTLHRWRREKRGPKHIKIGRSVYYKSSKGKHMSSNPTNREFRL
jgi:predicted DNA-binding transcriptional regulator AlpA